MERVELTSAVEVHFHSGAQDFCIAGNRQWQAPPILSEAELLGVAKAGEDETSSGSSSGKPSAVVFYVLEGEASRGAKFAKVLLSLAQALEGAVRVYGDEVSAGSLDVVVALAPDVDWELPERLAAVREAQARWPAGVKMRQPATVQRSDLSSAAVALLEAANNCCGWTEFQKLGAWNLLEYEAVLMLDADIRIYDKSLELLLAPTLDFVATPDAVTALNGGMLRFRPSAHTFEAMRRELSKFEYDASSGWAESGQLLPAVPNFFNKGEGNSFFRIFAGLSPAPLALETNQGFLFYFFFVLRASKSNALVDPCTYNFNIPKYALRYVCGRAARNGGSPSPGAETFTVKLCHKGCRPGRPIFSLRELGFLH